MSFGDCKLGGRLSHKLRGLTDSAACSFKSFSLLGLLCLYQDRHLKLKQVDAPRCERVLTIKIEDLFPNEYFYLIGFSRELILFSSSAIKMPGDVLEAYDTTCRVLSSLLDQVILVIN